MYRVPNDTLKCPRCQHVGMKPYEFVLKTYLVLKIFDVSPYVVKVLLSLPNSPQTANLVLPPHRYTLPYTTIFVCFQRCSPLLFLQSCVSEVIPHERISSLSDNSA